jgi:hypothetical protein
VNTALIESAAGLTFTSATDYPITFDDGAPEDSIGTPHFILEENRPTSWILSGGASASFADVDCSSYTPVGVKALILSYALVFTGNGTLDFAIVNARRNGSSETLDSKTRFMSCEYLNLASGVIFAVSGQRTVLCDSNGVFEYKVANGVLYINLEGYYY